MKKERFFVGLAILMVAIQIAGVIVFPANEKAIHDGSRIPENWTILGCDHPGCTETRNIGVVNHRLQVDAAGIASATISFASGTALAVANATGTALMTKPLYSTSVSESKYYCIPATSTSGFNLDPSSTASVFWCASEGTQTVRFFPNGTAGATAGVSTGLPYMTFAGEGVPVTNMSVYNMGAIADCVSCVYMLNP